MESALLSVQADLEYLRTLELQREVSVGTNNINSAGSSNSQAGATTPALLPPITQKAAYIDPTSKNPGLFPSLSSASSQVSVGSRGSSRTGSLFQNKRLTLQQQEQQSFRRRQHQQQSSQYSSLRTTTHMLLCDASKRLKELSTRHKQQVKQSTHERAYWQNDMHLKLEKFAMMCKHLNEDAALRNNEAKETKASLDKMTSERNTLSSQVDALRARVELYENERVAQSQMRTEWKEEKARLLEVLEKSIKERDEIIDDMSRRLDLSVETIENERRLHLMRRQIIFPRPRQQQPPSSQSSSQLDADVNFQGKQSFDSNHYNELSSSHHSPNISHSDVEDYLERIHKPKEIASKALEVAMDQSALRERNLQSRVESLERMLDSNNIQRSMEVLYNGKKGEMDNALNLGGGESGRTIHVHRISSSRSLGSSR